MNDATDPIDLTPDAPAPATRATPQQAAPDALAVAREKILVALRERHTVKGQLAWLLLGGGAAVMLAVSALVALILYFANGLLIGLGVGYALWFVLCLLAWAGVTVWVERRARAGFFTLMSADVDLTRDGTDDVLFQRTAATATSVVNALMFGPRAFVAGLHGVRGVPQRGLDLVLPEAADTLTLMLSIDGGVKIADLAAPGTDPLAMMPVLKWLDLNDYIGIATRGDRVWVSSPAKKRFAEAGIRVPKANETTP